MCMKFLKKIAVIPLAKNIGHIIDSFNTPDDKHLNAPSLNAVEQKMNTVQSAQISGIGNTNKLYADFTFKRSGKVVQVTSVITLKAGNNGSTIFADINPPDFVKSANNFPIILRGFTGFSIDQDNSRVSLSEAAVISIVYKNNSYSVVGSYAIGSVQSTDHSITMTTSFIVD